MTSYNKINGSWSSRNYDLVTDILRGEWSFHGLVMSDWGGSHGATASMYAGNDLIMPGNNPDEVINAAKKVTPAIDITGLPAYNKTIRVRNGATTVSWSWRLGNLTLTASGDQTVSTTVDEQTALRRLLGTLARKGYPQGLAYSVIRDELKNAGAESTLLDDAVTD